MTQVLVIPMEWKIFRKGIDMIHVIERISFILVKVLRICSLYHCPYTRQIKHFLVCNQNVRENNETPS